MSGTRTFSTYSLPATRQQSSTSGSARRPSSTPVSGRLDRPDAQADGRRVDDRAVGGDHPGSSSFPTPLVHGRRRQPHLPGQFRHSWRGRWRAAGRSAAGPRRRWVSPSCEWVRRVRRRTPSIAADVPPARTRRWDVPYLIVFVIAVVVVILVMRAAAASGNAGRPPRARPPRRSVRPSRPLAPTTTRTSCASSSAAPDGTTASPPEPSPSGRPARWCGVLTGLVGVVVVGHVPGQPRRPPGGVRRPLASPPGPRRRDDGARPGGAAGEGGGHEWVRWAGTAGRVPTHGELRRGLDDGRSCRAWKTRVLDNRRARGRGPLSPVRRSFRAGPSRPC